MTHYYLSASAYLYVYLFCSNMLYDYTSNQLTEKTSNAKYWNTKKCWGAQFFPAYLLFYALKILKYVESSNYDVSPLLTVFSIRIYNITLRL